VKSAPPAHTKVTLPLNMVVSGNASGYTYNWSYKAPNSTNYKPIAAKGTSIGKVSFVPQTNVPSLHIIGARGNLNGLQGYVIQLTVMQGKQVIGSAQTLLDGSCSLTIPIAREGAFANEDEQIGVQMYANPFRETLQLDVGGLSQQAKVSLYDLQGRMRGSWLVEPMGGVSQLKADVSALTEGMYLLQIETAQGVLHRQRVLKLR
jgi:hypothetical protein